jgi:hypothetical protein
VSAPRDEIRPRPGVVAMLLFAVAMASPAAAGLFRVWVNQDAVQIGYALSAEATRRKRVADAAQKLEVELAAERSPERLERLARRLGMGPPGPGRVFGASRGASSEASSAGARP